MIETLTIITLGILFLVFFRPGKTPPLENRLVIKRPGRYQITLAPRLNLAQPFIEAIAERVCASKKTIQDYAVLYFVVCDKQVDAHGSEVYLLSVICREEMLYFQAECPCTGNQSDYLDTIRAFTIDAMENIPAQNEERAIIEADIAHEIQTVAQNFKINVRQLFE